MAQALAVLINNPADLSRLYDRSSSPFASYIECETSTEENVLAESTVKDANTEDKMLAFPHEGDERQILQFCSGEVLQQEMNKYRTITVNELEKWLQNTYKSTLIVPLKLKSPMYTSMDTYSNNESPEKFVENDLFASDIDLSVKNMNNGLESIFDELSVEKSSSTLPELDNLDPLAQPTDINFTYKIVPSNLNQFCNNGSGNVTDLSVRLQEIVNSINDNNKVCENIRTQKTLQSDIDILRHDQTDNLYLSCISSSNIFDSPSNNVPNDVNIYDNDKYVSTNFKVNNVESCEMDYENLIPCYKLQTESKKAEVHKEFNTENSLDVKNKLQSSILKRKVTVSHEEVLTNKINPKTVPNTSNKENLADVNKSVNNNIQPVRPSLIIKKKLHLDSCDCHINKENYESNSESENSDHEETNKKQPLACRRTRKNINNFYEQEDYTLNIESENYDYIKTLKKLKKVGIDSTQFKCFRNEEDKKVWQCKLNNCDRIYMKPAHLRVHMMSHFNIRPFKCDYKKCSRAFSEKTQLDRHYTSHLKRNDYPCKHPNCTRRFTTAGNLSQHEKLHMRPKDKCKVIGCVVESRKIEKHMKESHDRSLAPYLCDFEGCQKRFFNKQAASWHKRVHKHPKELICSWEGCGKEFKSWPLLKAHMNVHSDRKPFACTFKGCEWAFATKSKLNRHRRMHTNDRRYFCDYENCDKAFLRAEHLTAHKISHTGKRLFKCNICDSNLATKSGLAVHLKKHKLRKHENNEKEDVVCSRVQPVRVITQRMKKKLLKAKTYAELDEKMSEEQDDDGELIKNIVNVIDSPGQDVKAIFMCPIELCSKLFVSKSELKLHLYHSHDLPLSDIQNDNLPCTILSSPPTEKNKSKNNNEYNEIDDNGKSDIIDVEYTQESYEEGDPLVKEFDIVLEVVNVDGNQIAFSNDLPFACF